MIIFGKIIDYGKLPKLHIHMIRKQVLMKHSLKLQRYQKNVNLIIVPILMKADVLLLTQ